VNPIVVAERPAAPRRRLAVLTPSADLYGSDRALLMALPAIVEHFAVTLVSAQRGPMLAEAEALGVDVVVSSDWALSRKGLRPAAVAGTAWRVGQAARLLRRLHATRHFDLVYANTMANALLPLLPRVIPAPLVVHVREVPRDRARLAKALLGIVERSATRVVCNSRFTTDLVCDLVPALAPRLVAVPDGIVPLDPVTPGDGAELAVVCVGRIHPKKGQAVLIEAARLAAAEGHRWQLHFWGDALPEHRELALSLRAAVAQAGLEHCVHWHGYRADTRALYEGMDVAVVPSVLPEEFSLVTAEAQVVGLPVVATGPGGPSDIIDEGVTGTVVAPSDPRALADALIALEDRTRRRAWGAAGRARTLERFTVDRYGPAVAHQLLATLPGAVPVGV